MSARQKRRLKAQQNLTLRNIVGAERYVRNDVKACDFKLKSVHEFVVRLARQMLNRMDNGPHARLHGFAPLQVLLVDVRPGQLLLSSEA